MKTWAYSIVALCFTTGLAFAGFRHPVELSTPEALAVQSTPIHGTSSSSRRVMPDRMPSQPAAVAPSAMNLPLKQRQQQVNNNILTAEQGPLPRSPLLPAAVRFQIPDPNYPNAAGGDGLLRMKAEALNLRGANRPQIHSFLRNARAMKLPVREYTKEVASREIAQRYRAALHPTPYKSWRTPYQLSLAGIHKIVQPPSGIQYENMVKRIDSLFYGLELRFSRAVLDLWQLSESPTNERSLQARDALFAGILGMRAGWEAPASNLLLSAARKGVDRNDRYLGILWKQLENLEHTTHVDNIVAEVNPARAAAAAIDGDKASYAMAKRVLLEKHRAPLAVSPKHSVFLERIASTSLRHRFQLLSLVGQIRSGQAKSREQAVDSLKTLEAEGDEGTRQEARLALARASLQKGDSKEALARYRTVNKNGKNRLEILAEQTFAEYLSGEYQDSLGKSVALQSPYFRYGFAPDVHLVEILSRKAMCDFGGAEDGVRRFAEQYGRELAAIEQTLAEHTAAAAYYEKLVSYHGSEQPLRFQRFLLQVPAVMENQKTMNHALVDLQKVDDLGVKQKILERPEGWDQFAQAMRGRWSERALGLRKISADAALREAAYMAKRLRQTFAQVELLDLDISTGAAKNYHLQSALNFPARKAAEVALDEHKFRWPYEDEIWEDEIDFMRAKNPTKCAVALR